MSRIIFFLFVVTLSVNAQAFQCPRHEKIKRIHEPEDVKLIFDLYDVIAVVKVDSIDKVKSEVTFKVLESIKGAREVGNLHTTKNESHFLRQHFRIGEEYLMTLGKLPTSAKSHLKDCESNVTYWSDTSRKVIEPQFRELAKQGEKK